MCQCCTESIVPVKDPLHIVLLILNILLPGIGTIANGCMGSSISGCQIVIGLLQMCLSPVLLIGWFWSIWWGVIIYQRSVAPPTQETLIAQ